MSSSASQAIKDKNTKHQISLIYFLLLIFGRVMAFYSINNSVFTRSPYGRPIWDFYMQTRLVWLDTLIKEVNQTGIYTGLHRLYNHNSVMYLYLSRLGVFLGADSAYTIYFAQLTITAAWMTVLPALWYRATSSIPRAVASSLFFAVFCPYSVYFRNDSYFASSMMTFVRLPVLFFLFREKWSKQHILWIIFLRLVAGGANVFRSQAGLGTFSLIILLITLKLIVPAFKNKSRKDGIKSAGVLLSIFLCYSLFTSFIPSAYQRITGQPEPLPIMGPWHSRYIGLRWEENPLGITYSDNFAYKGKEDLLYDVSDGYYLGVESPQYIDRIKKEYFNAIKSYPGFFFGSYIRKFFYCFKTIWKNSVINPVLRLKRLIYPSRIAFYAYIVIIPTAIVRILYTFLKKNREKIKDILTGFGILGVLFLAGLSTGIAGIPINRTYIYGAVAAADCLVLVAFMMTFQIFWTSLKTIYRRRKCRKS